MADKDPSDLALALAAANHATYLAQMRAYARGFAQTEPEELTDQDVLDGIDARAAVSAASIAKTDAAKEEKLRKEHETEEALLAALLLWRAAHATTIARYEATLTTHVALREFTGRNKDLTGTEHIEPETGICEACQEAIGMGRQPLGTFDDFPLHIGCDHVVVTEFDDPADASGLWFGNP